MICLKRLKRIVIYLIIIGVIAGTCVYFFSNYRREHNFAEAAEEFIYSESLAEFNEDINVVSLTGGERFEYILTANSELQNINSIFISYLRHADYEEINHKNRNDELKQVKNRIRSVMNLIEEYKIKSKNESFNKVVGANGVYKEASKYIVDYANLLKGIMLDLDVILINKDADFKFTMIDLYLNVCDITFSNITTIDDVLQLHDNLADNADIVFNNFNLSNGYFETGSTNGNFSIYNNYFMEEYSKCNKTRFVKHLASNIADVTSLESVENAEQMATYYYKEIFDL